MAYINGNEILFSPIINGSGSGGGGSGETAVISNGTMITIEAATVTVENENTIVIGG